MKYSIVIPCYKSDQTIGRVVELIHEEFKGQEFNIVLVNDGSPDEGKTYRAIRALTQKYDNVIGIDLAKNTGQHNATLCALNYAEGDYIICMDDDLQTHPAEINKLIKKMEEGYDVVYASYPDKKHAWYRNIGSRFNSWTLSKLVGKPKNLRTSSFWLARKFVRDYVIKYKNANTFIPGLILRTTSNIANVEVNHYDREIGKSGYSFKSLVRLWSNVIGYSVRPLRLASKCGIFLSCVGLIGALYFLLRKLIFGSNAAGWTSLFVGQCFFFGIELLFIGLIGEYIGRMFLDSGNKPQYVIRTIDGGMENEEGNDTGRGNISGSAN